MKLNQKLAETVANHLTNIGHVRSAKSWNHTALGTWAVDITPLAPAHIEPYVSGERRLTSVEHVVAEIGAESVEQMLEWLNLTPAEIV
jgi:hypothetical protein